MFECWNGTKYIFTHLELYTYAVVIQTYKHIYDIYIYIYNMYISWQKDYNF